MPVLKWLKPTIVDQMRFQIRSNTLELIPNSESDAPWRKLDNFLIAVVTFHIVTLRLFEEDRSNFWRVALTAVIVTQDARRTLLAPCWWCKLTNCVILHKSDRPNTLTFAEHQWYIHCKTNTCSWKIAGRLRARVIVEATQLKSQLRKLAGQPVTIRKP